MAGPARGQSPVLRQWLWLLLLTVVFIAAAIHRDWLWRANLGLYDAMLGRAAVSPRVLVVGIDEPSLRSLGRWPWRRSLHAALLDRLRSGGARAVALDVLLTEPEQDEPADDAILAAAMSRGLPVVLPIAPEADASGELTEARPMPLLAGAAAGFGHAEVEIDGDGIVRSVFLKAGSGVPSLDHLAVSLARAATGTAPRLSGARNPSPGPAPGAWVRDYRFLIPFAGPAATLPHVSYIDVLEGRVPESVLHDRVVLVGLTGLGLPDAYATPQSAYGVPMPGVEISASVVNALLTGQTVRPAGEGSRLALGLLLVLLAFGGFLWLRPRQSLVLIACLAVGTLALEFSLVRVAGWWWPAAEPLVALVLLYPLWSWRRLEAAQAYLEAEFVSLRGEELPLLKRPPRLEAVGARLDPFQHQIDLVRDAAAELRAVRRLFADTVQSLPDPTLVVDLQGRVVLANPEATRVIGADGAGGLQGRHVDATLLEVLTGGRLDFVALSEAAPCAVETRSARLERDFLVRVVPFAGDGGIRLGTIIDLADITELRRVQRERDEVIGFLSHDMKGPASSLAGLAVLQRDPARALPAGPLAEQLATLAQRTLSLVDGFLAIARAQALDPLVFAEFAVHDAVQDAVDETWAAAAARGIVIGWRAPPQAWLVTGDRTLVARAVANLVGNAVKFSASGTTVRILLTCSGPECRVAVTDEGPGIPESVRGALFTRYARGLHGGESDPGGAGLGLAFVHTVATRHGGRVEVASEVGVGSTFSLVLPTSGPATDWGAP